MKFISENDSKLLLEERKAKNRIASGIDRAYKLDPYSLQTSELIEFYEEIEKEIKVLYESKKLKPEVNKP